MAGVRINPHQVERGQTEPAAAVARMWLSLSVVTAILGGSLASSAGEPDRPAQPPICEVHIRGNINVPESKISPQIHSRAGRPYDPQVVNEDIRRLYQMRKFIKVSVNVQDALGGKVLYFDFVEKPILHHVKFVGGERMGHRTLAKEAGLKRGDPMDPYTVEEGRRKLIEYYHSKGFSKVYIEIYEGSRPNDAGAIYVINEGPKEKVWWTSFVGNTVADAGRLRTQIHTSRGFLWLFSNELDHKELDEDDKRLTDYYHSLGYFSVQVGHVIEFNEDQNWATIVFYIDEGPRYMVRDVKLAGNQIFSTPELTQEFKLRANQPFLRSKLLADKASLQDIYGSEGFVFTKIDPQIRFLEQPGIVNIVYGIRESGRYEVGKINVHIKGENQHTQFATVLNRLSIYPGQIVDTRELRNSERRLKASNLFKNEPQNGVSPKIVFTDPNAANGETDLADSPDRPTRSRGFRGQSPDPEPYEAHRPVQPCDLGSDEEIHGVIDQPTRPQDYPGTSSLWDGPWDNPVEDSAEGAIEPAPLPPPVEPEPETIIRGQIPDGGSPAGTFQQAAQATQPQSPPPVAANNWAPAPATAPQPDAYTPKSLPSGSDARHGSYWTPTWVSPSSAGAPSGYSLPILPAQSPPGSPEPLRTAQAGPGYLGGTSVSPQGGSNTGLAAPSTYPPAMGPAQLPPQYGNPTGAPTGLQGAYASPGPAVGQPPLIDPSTWGRPPADVPAPLALTPELEEGQTGKFMVSVGVNSELGLVGTVVVEEQNFDILRFPSSWDDVLEGKAWRGAGQRFRLQLSPGTQFSQYLVSWTEPYLLGGPYSLGLSGYYNERLYTEYTEFRTGGQVIVGRQLGTPELTATLAFRGEEVEVKNPIYPDISDINQALGFHSLFGLRGALTLDKRDNPVLATEGFFAEAGFQQVFGSFTYPQADFTLRKYFMLHERPDQSGATC